MSVCERAHSSMQACSHLLRKVLMQCACCFDMCILCVCVCPCMHSSVRSPLLSSYTRRWAGRLAVALFLVSFVAAFSLAGAYRVSTTQAGSSATHFAPRVAPARRHRHTRSVAPPFSIHVPHTLIYACAGAGAHPSAHIPEEELEKVPSFLQTRLRNLAGMACRSGNREELTKGTLTYAGLPHLVDRLKHVLDQRLNACTNALHASIH